LGPPTLSEKKEKESKNATKGEVRHITEKKVIKKGGLRCNKQPAPQIATEKRDDSKP